ncbi:Uncharacterised protein [Mycobacterium tuberculosis]|uniref:Uncharacterized protein n=1 Tax=Mycobacterium tuberculosis TaxID=1773 RepID=A0A655J395_MYCTX|nr:Uncharacterised protein [Mycobacterium tuberculosis]COX41717.1 Uncharacterised protein [Mycobacterium tuberculosis]
MPPGVHTRLISCSARTGSATCCSTWCAWTTSNASSGKSSLCTSEVVNEMFDRRCSWASARARLKASSVGSTPVTDPGTTRAARSTVIVPGPQPTSSTDNPGTK